MAVEQACRHEVALAGREPFGDQPLRPLQIHESNLATVADDLPTVAALQRRAGDHAAFAAVAPTLDYLRDCSEPWCPVAIGERLPTFHLCHVFGRVEAVTLGEFPAELLGQPLPDRRFSCTRYAHEDRDPWAFGALASPRCHRVWRMRHARSPPPERCRRVLHAVQRPNRKTTGLILQKFTISAMPNSSRFSSGLPECRGIPSVRSAPEAASHPAARP